MMTMSNETGPFGNTTLTKVFVGGLAWETPKEVMREHFERYGEILEAVIISDKMTGRSKGYGFVTFKEASAAKRACEDAAPVINGRRANCNLASLGARRPRSTNVTPPRQGSTVAGPMSTSPSPGAHVQPWYYPATAPFHHYPLSYYGYSPAYAAADISYGHKLSYTNGAAFMNGHYSHLYPAQAVVTGSGGTPLMPIYPLYHQTAGLPAANIYPPATVPAIISKPAAIAASTSVCLTADS